ncbi:hypothetical protein EHQ53_09385 [Leptospira langatensis]|uniref:Uncharacterized protein n=1 Tax=Leptospira langatensis TaxID=2484983 RepID=A0A5F1ZXR9_9LEPT|nr:transmembrane 220 family protein [Leptospira langatensis]TGK01171.1 hypothetical protein EHO57_09490 [Leptospira langatensis]TGL42377.1 hypothetical protein EHQ53_09385 [Leptospira langatensis]
MIPFFTDSLRIATVLAWLVLAGLQYREPDSRVWILAYLTVSLLFATEWFLFFRDTGRRILIAGLGKSIAIGYFIWAMYIYLDDPRPNLESRIFRESMGLIVSAIWLFLLPVFQRSEEA